MKQILFGLLFFAAFAGIISALAIFVKDLILPNQKDEEENIEGLTEV